MKQALTQPDQAVLKSWEQREQGQLTARGKGLKLHPVKVLKISTPNIGAGFDIDGVNKVNLNRPGGMVAFDISTQLPDIAEPVTGLRVVVHPDPKLPGGGWGSGPGGKHAKGKKVTEDVQQKGTFMLTSISITADTIAGDQINLHKLQSIARTTANSWDVKNPPAGCLDPRNDSGWSPDPATNGAVRLTATFAEPLNSRQTPFLTTQLNFGHGDNLVPQHIELFAITGRDDDSDLPPGIIRIFATPLAQRSAEQKAELWTYCAAHAEELQRTRIDLANLEERLATLTQSYPTMVMNISAKPRDTFILNRGDYAQPTEKVTAGTIAALPPMPEGASADRLGLAKWITMKSNPLTARVAVNRFWKMIFGTGIVGTPADFGAQGEWPSHPDLLDWLAVEFMESGWDVKHLIKLIVTSETYRQSSAATPEMLDRDPQNRLLARGPRFRLPAELLRDAALKTSGLLVDRVGGPSVNPYTPGDLWREVSHYGSTPATAQTFVQDHGEKLYRRSLYTYWKRTAAPPNMTAFDAPNREVCTIARGNTTTPLQALVTLNDPQFVEAARAFAERIQHQAGDDAAKLRWAFAESTSREPKPAELKVLQSALARERMRYTTHATAALVTLGIGESPRDQKLPPAEHAAWMQVATLILNLSESVTRN